MPEKITKKNCVMGRLALLAMTLIWGTSFVVLKNTLVTVPTLYVLAYRFSGAAVLMLLLGIKDIKKLDLQYVKNGAVMGVFLFIAYTFQTFGLEQTTPGKNAFLTTTYCVLVPFIYWIIEKKRRIFITSSRLWCALRVLVSYRCKTTTALTWAICLRFAAVCFSRCI